MEPTCIPARYRLVQSWRVGAKVRASYGVRKTLAKYLDEFNWYEMVGKGRVARGG